MTGADCGPDGRWCPTRARWGDGSAGLRPAPLLDQGGESIGDEHGFFLGGGDVRSGPALGFLGPLNLRLVAAGSDARHEMLPW